MSVTCPCCGSTLSDKHAPLEALAEAPMSPQQREIVRFLAAKYPHGVTTSQIFDHLYHFDPNGGPDNSCSVMVQIVNVRKRIEPFGWTIPRNGGAKGSHPGAYRLEPLP